MKTGLGLRGWQEVQWGDKVGAGSSWHLPGEMWWWSQHRQGWKEKSLVGGFENYSLIGWILRGETGRRHWKGCLAIFSTWTNESMVVYSLGREPEKQIEWWKIRPVWGPFYLTWDRQIHVIGFMGLQLREGNLVKTWTGILPERGWARTYHQGGASQGCSLAHWGTWRMSISTRHHGLASVLWRAWTGSHTAPFNVLPPSWQRSV